MTSLATTSALPGSGSALPDSGSVLPGSGPPAEGTGSAPFGHARALTCRECGASFDLGGQHACSECFGPL